MKSAAMNAMKSLFGFMVASSGTGPAGGSASPFTPSERSNRENGFT
jgi:hypothetical protein